MSPNIGNLLNDVLIPNLLNNPFASCFLINLNFLLLHIAHFHNIISLPLLVLEIVDLCFLYISYILCSMIPFLYFCIIHKIIQNCIIIFLTIIR